VSVGLKLGADRLTKGHGLGGVSRGDVSDQTNAVAVQLRRKIPKCLSFNGSLFHKISHLSHSPPAMFDSWDRTWCFLENCDNRSTFEVLLFFQIQRFYFVCYAEGENIQFAVEAVNIMKFEVQRKGIIFLRFCITTLSHSSISSFMCRRCPTADRYNR
jgi:hypothetical protein